MGNTHKALSLGEIGNLGSPTTPSPEQYARIRSFLLDPVPAEELYVRRLNLANDAVDRSFERFPLPYLQRLADTLPGKALLLAHDKTGTPTGLFFEARTRPSVMGEAGEHQLEAWFYLRKTEANAELRAQIDAGVCRYCSIGASYDERYCSVCALPYYECRHMPGQKLDDGRTVHFDFGGDLSRYESREGSLVYLGAQRLAQLTKQAYEGHTDMDAAQLEQKLKEANTELAGLKERLAVFEKGGTPAPAPAPDASLAADGKAYREHLITETKRLAKIAGEEEEAELLLDALTDRPAATLKKVHAKFEKKVAALFPDSPSAALVNAATGQDEPKPKAAEAPLRQVSFF